MAPPRSTTTVPAATPAATATHDPSARSRFVGASALAVAAAVVAENVVLGATGAPSYSTPMSEVLSYYAANRTAVAVAAGLVAVYLPLLLVFLTGLQGLVERRGGAGTDGARLAVAAGAALAAVFVLVNVLQVGVALSAGTSAEPTRAAELVWQVHAAGFALVLPMLAATVVGATLATHRSGLTRGWQRLLGLASGALLLGAGVGNLAIADGSPLLFVGLLGFAGWLAWMVATGLRLVRRSSPS